jgi:hypothetical protein
MSPAAFARLQKAADFVLEQLGKKVPAQVIIGKLVNEHGAIYRRGDPNRLRVAGLQVTCTWSDTDGLLAAWKGKATIKIAMERQSA